MTLVHGRTSRIIASSVELACTRAERRRGLLGRDRLDRSAAMILTPCFAVHTAFMHFSIDVLFLDGDGLVRRVVSNLKPWRMAVDVRGRTVVELASGVAGDLDIRTGDHLILTAESARERSWRSLATAS
jgi:uncharacterized membrane protein (UPF0127 family)